MTAYKKALINLLDNLSDDSIRRVYRLAEYLYKFVEGSGEKMNYKSKHSREYVEETIRILQQIGDEKVLCKIYTVAKTFLKIHAGERPYIMNRYDIAEEIATELLNDGALDENNFGNDTDALVEHVQSVILKHFKDYMLIQGNAI